jgi:hypothetical protein
MNPLEMIVLVLAIVVLVSILRGRSIRIGREHGIQIGHDEDDAEKQRLREEVQELKERVAVLERIATDSGTSLAHEIEKLRDR